jgi:PPM family protein phosphatase
VATDSFCESCGHDLRVQRSAGPAAPANRTCTGCGDPVEPGAEYCAGCGLRGRDGTDHVEIHLPGLAGITDRGKVHARNEDAMALGRRDTPTGVLIAVVVCDGVSSAPRPELASRLAADTALDRLLEAARPTPGGADTAPIAEVRVRDAVAAAAAAVATLQAPGEADAPACTLVAALVEPAAGGDRPVITIGWVGDSRAYWLAPVGSPEPSRQLTSDHSWAAEMVAAGAISEAAALTGSAAHAITRWLGADGRPTPDVISFRPAADGGLLLCSDGLWNYLPAPDRLAAVARPLLDGDPECETDPGTGTGPLAVAAELTTLALTAGGHDNITVALVPVTGRAVDQHPTDPRRSP